MSELRFRCHFESWELREMTLPVEVRKSNLALVVQGVTSQPVQVEAGTYHVTARLPTGQELYSPVTVGERGSFVVDLYPEAEEKSPHEGEEVQRYIHGRKAFAGRIKAELESLGEAQAHAALRLFRGNLLKGAVKSEDSLAAFEPLPPPAPGTALLRLQADPPSLVQLLQPGAPPTNTLLPARPGESAAIRLERREDGRLVLDVQLNNLMADALLRYYARGLVAQADNLTANDSPALLSEDLLYGKVADPLAACVGAYTLLRLGDITRLHEWSENLKNWFGWLPDGAAIRAEHLARRGDHEEALKALLELPARGAPFFSDGLSFAVNRLRTYVELGKSDEPFERRPEAEQLLASLRPFAAYADFRNPVLTFTGLDPAAPDDRPLEGDPLDYGGLDVTPHLG